jgi:hypothetical protein
MWRERELDDDVRRRVNNRYGMSGAIRNCILYRRARKHGISRVVPEWLATGGWKSKTLVVKDWE